MRNIKLILAFDGTAYAGWQRQPDRPTIQGTVEEKVTVMTGAAVPLHGAGRTDAGVHALGMAANFRTGSAIPCAGFVKGLNSLLPDDIRIRSAEEVGDDFHACHSAVAKTYCYNLILGREMLPTERLYNSRFAGHFTLDTMRACLECIMGTHDFSSFEATGSRDLSWQGGRGAVRRIINAELVEDRLRPGRVQLRITGDGFLRHMVRNLVGTLVEVGQGRRSVADFAAVLAARDRALAGPTAPPQGLFLEQVHYHALPAGAVAAGLAP